ncbi:aspartate/glutamate racemase family protein [Alloiococcus sp. CFN-8]|uniref:aspartate/glutamate racemase family protein n=1 Tax=Alloiococcus sp. CFN-8 TaxID=3416081 RepID=UPI003CF98EE9
MKTLGVIGGIGPLATAYFMELLVNITEASGDQEHIDAIIYSRPSIPDRTSYILKKSKESPVNMMVDIGKKLQEQGASFIAIPCITAHSFYKEIAEEIEVPVINALEEIAVYLKAQKINRAGVFATDGTLYSKCLQRTLESHNIEVILPSEKSQSYLMEIIYNNIKSGKKVDKDKFDYIKDDMDRKEAEVIILGCSELSLLKKNKIIGPGFIDPMEVLAKRAIELCGGKVKEEYKSLITK